MALLENIQIEEISPDDEGWVSFLQLVEEQSKVEHSRILLDIPHILERHILTANAAGEVIGFLRYNLQRIGDGEDRPLVKFNGRVLIEAKIISFFVLSQFRNQGVGKALQMETIRRARQSGCYQVRSRSNYDREANHHLKISLGFGIQPSLEDDSVYFVMKV